MDAVPMKVAAINEHDAPAERRRQQRLELLDVFGTEFVRLVRQQNKVRPQINSLFDRGARITFAGGSENVVKAKHPQHVMGISVSVEAHPWVLPNRTEGPKAQLGPWPQSGLDHAHL